MRKIEHQALINYSAQQMYQLVNDVAAYPEFLPWCAASEVISITETQMTASLSIKKGGIAKTFTTKNELLTDNSITMNLVDGPFKHMQGIWHFKPLADDACKVSFSLDFSFDNKLLALTLGPIFAKIADQRMPPESWCSANWIIASKCCNALRCCCGSSF